MRRPGLLFFMVLAVFLCRPLLCQDSLDVESFLQALENETVGETDLLLVVENLRRHPIALNQATLADLLEIPFLDIATARAILDFRKRHGRFRALSELDSVPGLPAELADLLRPLFTLRPPGTGAVLEYRVRTARRLHLPAGFEPQTVPSPLDVYQRLFWQPRPDWQIRLLWQKDAGETNWFDYGSLSFRYRPEGKPLEVLAGDFHLRWGQQLVFGSAYGTPLAVEQLTTLWPGTTRLIPNAASQESFFLRGLAGEIRPTPNIRLGALASWRRLDARLEPDSLTVRSFDVSGLHRTALEQKRKGNTREQITALWLRWTRSRWDAGVLAAGQQFNRPVLQSTDTLTGRQQFLSAFFQHRGPFFGSALELALRNGRFPAVQQTLNLNLGPLRYWLNAYYYHPRYGSFHGRALDEIQKSPGNRKGSVLGASLNLPGRVKLALLVHRERAVRPADQFARNQTRLQLLGQWRPPALLLNLRYTYRKRTEGEPSGAGQVQQIHRLRLDLAERASARFALRQRVEVSWAHPRVPGEAEVGFSAFSELSWRPARRWRLQWRWTQFQVPAFPLALYEYEPDLPGSFRVALLNGRGYKWFALLSGRVSPTVQVHLKFRQEVFPDLEEQGRQGKRRREIRLQVDLRY